MTVSRQHLHPDGPELSRFVWGAWRSVASEATDTPAKLARLIDGCLELGITSFDHADIYGGYRAEAHFGAALREWRGDRTHIQLVTKCDIALVNASRPAHRVHHYDTSATHIRHALEASLRQLGTDHVDLLLLHRPDPLLDVDETAAALEDVLRAGKTLHVGVSNHTPWQIDLLQSRLAIPLVTNQIELSVIHTTPLFDGTLDHAQQHRAAPMAWSPLGGGGLFTRATPQGERLGHALDQAAAALGAEPAQVALAWLLRHPSRPVPVLGTSRVERLRALVAAEQVELDRQDWFALLEASVGHEVP
jgi:predicted oxidoreductase